MDPQYLGTNLPVLGEAVSAGHPLFRESGEDAYYRRHSPSNRGFLPIASLVASVMVGFVAAGLRLH